MTMLDERPTNEGGGEDSDRPTITRIAIDDSAQRSWFRKILFIPGGITLFPLLVLLAIYTFDEFDTAGFSVLVPHIKHAFGLSTQDFGFVVAAQTVIVLALAIPLGYYGDRLPRRTIVVVGALIAGVCSLLTGLASSVLILILVRIGRGVGVLVNDPIHRSLLSDYYEPEARPSVFATHANAVRFGQLLGAPIMGGITVLFGWRWAFGVLIVPVVTMAAVATRLPPVTRGQTDDPESAEVAAMEAPVPFDRAVRMLWTVPTLRWQFYSWIFIGAGFLPLGFYFPDFLDRAFHLNSFEVGLVISVGGAFALVGVQLSGRWTRAWMMQDLGRPLSGAGLALALVGPGLLLAAVAPDVPIALVGIWWAFFVGGIFAPAFLTVQSLVSPARVRTLSFAFGSIFLAAGFVGFLLFFGNIANDDIRAGVASLVPFWFIGGAVLASGRRYVTADTMRALKVLSTTAELRRARLEAGEQSLLVCREVDVAYGSTQVLFGVDFEVKEGEIVALLGTNGAGKSTLLKTVAGNIEAIGGAIFYDGHDITGMGAPAAAAAGVALVPGGKGVFPGLTVEDNLALAAWLLRKDDAFIKSALDDALGFFPILRERWDQKAGNLSGGEQQMLTIAMALLARPKLLMIDELSLGLAPLIVERLLGVVRQINQSGITVVLVEQSVNVALTLADRAVFMEKGEVRFDGPTADLLDRPDILRSVFLEGAATAVGADEEGLVGGDGKGTTASKPGAKKAAKKGATNGSANGATNGEANGQTNGQTNGYVRTPFVIPTDRKGRERPPVLSTSDLAVSFGGIRAVDGVDLTVHEGQIVGVIGPNGAGKTTIFDLISGFLVPDAGRIVLEGKDVTRLTPDARARRGLGRSFQDARLFPSMTVRQTISVALERHIRTRDPLAASLASPATRAAEREVDENVTKLIDLMRLGAFANKFIMELSTGSRRIVDLACVLAHEPSVLLLDEPSSGIAQRETEALGPLLLDIRDETGAGLIVIEHDMPLITSISDEMVALELGQVIVRGSPRDVINDPQVVASYLGTTEEVIQRSGTDHTLHDAFVHEGQAPPKAGRRPTNGSN